jgi:predicted site-specific integrase-resolvase
MTEPLFIRLKKASTMLGGVTPATLRRWNKQGILKMTKLSPRVMGYTQEQLEAFAQGRRAKEDGK